MELRDETCGALQRRCTVRVKGPLTEVRIPAAAPQGPGTRESELTAWKTAK